MFSSKPLPSSFFIHLVTHLSVAETIFFDICQSSSNSPIALLFWDKAGSPARLTKLLLDFSFWSRWSNLGQIYTPTWSNEKKMETVVSRCKISDSKEQWFWEMRNKVNTTVSQLTTLRKFPGHSAQREPRCRQAEFLWTYNTCRSMIYGNNSTKARRGKMKVCYSMILIIYVKLYNINCR